MKTILSKASRISLLVVAITLLSQAMPCLLSVDAVAGLGTGNVLAQLKPEEVEILAGADKRIEKYRKTTATLRFLTRDGRPVSGARVEVEQEGHEFLFGLNTSIVVNGLIYSKKYGLEIPKHWLKKYKIDDRQVEEYRRRFFEFANYTSLPVGWRLYESKKGDIDYALYDSELKWFHENGSKVLAHQLVWNNRSPEWVPRDCGKLSKAVEKRVRDFIGYYKDRYDYYLLLNEPSNPFRPIFKKNKMTRCIKKIGKEAFYSRVFEVAREAYPAAKLMINEVSIREKYGFPELLDSLKDSKGRPLYDIIGIQSHMHKKLWTLDSVWKVCEGYSRFGVPIHFTEVTVLSGTPNAGKNFGKRTTLKGERIQAEYVVNLYTTLFSHPAVEGIMWWNLTDLAAWKNAPAGLLRKDMTPKPAYFALKDLIRNKWWTKTQAVSSDEGKVEFKGFFGAYKITLIPEDGKPRIFRIELLKKGVRDFNLVLDD